MPDVPFLRHLAMNAESILTDPLEELGSRKMDLESQIACLKYLAVLLHRFRQLPVKFKRLRGSGFVTQSFENSMLSCWNGNYEGGKS